MTGRTAAAANSSSRPPTATRRQLLAATGVLAAGGLAGCLGRVASASTSTGASPAAFFSGDADDIGARDETLQTYSATGADIRYVPSTLRGGSGLLAGNVEIEGWATTGTTRAQGYNSSRSNKPSTEWWSDPDDDGDGLDDAVELAVLDIERELVGYLEAARIGESGLSKADAKRALEAFSNATTRALESNSRLQECPSEACGTVREHMEDLQGLAGDAVAAADEENWDDAAALLDDMQRILEGDIDRLEDALDPELAESIGALRAYLDDEPIIGEWFAITLPDARLPGDLGTVAAELSPKRLANGLIDEVREDDKVEAGTGGDDDCDDGQLPQTPGLDLDVACTNPLSATVTAPKTPRRGVVAVTVGEGVCVTGASPDADGAETRLAIRHDQTTPLLYQGRAEAPKSLTDWGTETTVGDVTVSPTIVMPVLAQPPDCPSPLPAFLYLRRSKHDEQCVYSGGWVLDDGPLYLNAATLLLADGPTEVLGVTPEDVGSDRYGALVARRATRERSGHGSTMVAGTLDPDADYLPAALGRKEGRKGMNAVDVKVIGEAGDGDGNIGATETLAMALDAPVVHLATSAGRDVKFKAGAELSKAVN